MSTWTGNKTNKRILESVDSSMEELYTREKARI